MTERPSALEAESLQDSPIPDIQPPASSGSPANGSSSNGASPAAASAPEGLVGQVVDGTVSGITHFGAFITLENGQTGLIHISEIAYEYVRDIRDHLKLNEQVKVKVLQVNPANGKYDLSLKQTREAPAAALPKWRRGKRDRLLPEGADPVFEEKLSKFMKSSEERLLDVKRNLEAKRGGRFR